MMQLFLAHKKAISRTMMFGFLLSFLTTTGSCKSTSELSQKRKEKRIENRRVKDSIFQAEKHNNFLLMQEQNNQVLERVIEQ